MTQKPAMSRLNGPLRGRINRLAHRLAVAHENALRSAMLACVSAATEAGATLAALHGLIDAFESGKVNCLHDGAPHV